MNRGAQRATAHRVAKSRSELSNFHFRTEGQEHSGLVPTLSESESVSHSVVSESLRPCGLFRLLCL